MLSQRHAVGCSGCDAAAARAGGNLRVLPAVVAVPMARGQRDELLTFEPQASKRGALQVVRVKGKLSDDLLDYVTAGPKMRKWYGQGERPSEANEEGQPGPDDEDEDYGEGDAILVTDADSAIGEQVILQLILARAEIRVLVKDTTAAKTAYGPYVTPVSIDTSNPATLKKALKGCGSVVCLGRPGALLQVARAAGIVHILMLSSAGSQQGGFLSGLLDRELSDVKDVSREEALVGSGQRYTLVRVGGVRNVPGGASSFQLVPLAGPGAPSQPAAPVSREDLAAVIVQSLLRPPPASRAFQVITSPGSPPSMQEWGNLLAAVTPTAESAAA